MIRSMPTTARPQQRYDHRLRNLVQRTGDVTVATDLGVPRSTARGWLGAAPTVLVFLEVADLIGSTDAPRGRAIEDMVTSPAYRHVPTGLRRALQGRFRPHHAFLIEQIFAKIDFLDKALERLTTEIDQRLVPFEPMLTALDTIPGVDRIGAISIVAETGGDMTRFLTAGHLCSWGAMCPGQNESAGKRRSGKPAKAIGTC